MRRVKRKCVFRVWEGVGEMFSTSREKDLGFGLDHYPFSSSVWLVYSVVDQFASITLISQTFSILVNKPIIFESA